MRLLRPLGGRRGAAARALITPAAADGRHAKESGPLAGPMLNCGALLIFVVAGVGRTPPSLVGLVIAQTE